MNIDGLDFDIIDYVKIRLDMAIDPKDQTQYDQNWEFMYSRAQTWGDLNHSAANFYISPVKCAFFIMILISSGLTNHNKVSV